MPSMPLITTMAAALGWAFGQAWGWTIVRAPNGEEAELLRSEGADVALHPHGTLAQALLEVALAKWTTSATPPRPHP